MKVKIHIGLTIKDVLECTTPRFPPANTLMSGICTKYIQYVIRPNGWNICALKKSLNHAVKNTK